MSDGTLLETAPSKPIHFSHAGWCPACEQNAMFVAKSPSFRGALLCDQCGSRPRNRAMMHALSTYFPKWKNLAIHEGSPDWDIVSRRLVAECKAYTASQLDTSVPFGTVVTETRLPCKKYQSENLEAQTFADRVFDLVITQDVFEHVMYPNRAIREIVRTLKPNGATLMTVPIVNRTRPSIRRARMVNGETTHLLEAQYHGNPMGGGALVTVDWGYDIVRYFQAHSGLSCMLIQVDNIDLGIRADWNDVVIGFKGAVPDLS